MDHVPLPKSDLAVFFTLSALMGANIWAPAPKEVTGCLNPDSGEERCFPFFFMEVKRSADNLEAAFRANLHSASQALYNIFQWMSLVDLHENFLDKGPCIFHGPERARDKVRVHRATLHHDRSLCFHFDDVASLTNYTRDQACQLVKGVLFDYAKTELHGILTVAFQKVSEKKELLAQQDVRNSRNKRRADSLQSQSSSKRGRSRIITDVPPVPGDVAGEVIASASSFGASGLTI